MCYLAQHMCSFFILCSAFRHICARIKIYVPNLIPSSVLKFESVLCKDKIPQMRDKLQNMQDKLKNPLDKFTSM
jgi:hypothetical protein